MRALLLGAALVHSCTSQRDATTAPFDDLSPLPPLSVGSASASYYRQRGASAFRRNELAASCEAFDEVVALSPRSAATLWQRGISLYYCERQADGMDQFELDVARNPNDTEEMIWHFLCNARARAETVGAARAVGATTHAGDAEAEAVVGSEAGTSAPASGGRVSASSAVDASAEDELRVYACTRLGSGPMVLARVAAFGTEVQTSSTQLRCRATPALTMALDSLVPGPWDRWLETFNS